MPDKDPQFTVTDRRKFTSEGDLRDGEAPPSEAPATPPPAVEREVAKPVQPEAAKPVQPVEKSAAPEEELIPEPTAEESAQQSKDYHASTRQLDDMLRQANPGQGAAAPMNFDRLVQSIYMTAALQMGAATAPNEQPRVDILGARQSIDMLTVLEEKTRGNLSPEEQRLLQSALFDLRMSFLEITNAIAASAQRQPKPDAAR